MCFYLQVLLLSGLPGGSDGRESACNAEDLSSIPGSGKCPGEGNDYLCQCFGLENPMYRGAWYHSKHASHHHWGAKQVDWMDEHMEVHHHLWNINKYLCSTNNPVGWHQSHSLNPTGTHWKRPTQWTWVWASSGRWWRTREPGALQSMGLQRAGHNLASEQGRQGAIELRFGCRRACLASLSSSSPASLPCLHLLQTQRPPMYSSGIQDISDLGFLLPHLPERLLPDLCMASSSRSDQMSPLNHFPQNSNSLSLSSPLIPIHFFFELPLELFNIIYLFVHFSFLASPPRIFAGIFPTSVFRYQDQCPAHSRWTGNCCGVNERAMANIQAWRGSAGFINGGWS